MFIRKKRIKKYEYAYLVKNRWKKKGKKGNSRQKNIKYLGRVFNLNEILTNSDSRVTAREDKEENGGAIVFEGDNNHRGY